MSKKKNKYDKSIDEYIEISKGDITLYTILSLVVIKQKKWQWLLVIH